MVYFRITPAMPDKETHICPGMYCKVGFSKDLVTFAKSRVQPYRTADPAGVFINRIKTQGRTKMQVERAYHREVESMGYKFGQGPRGKADEWFFVPFPQATEFWSKGLRMFKTTGNREVIDFQSPKGG